MYKAHYNIEIYKKGIEEFRFVFFILYSDTICELGGALELANYGEYSGAPSESQTYQYAKTILKLALLQGWQNRGLSGGWL